MAKNGDVVLSKLRTIELGGTQFKPTGRQSPLTVGFYDGTKALACPCVGKAEWVEWAIGVVSSDLARELSPRQAAPVHVLSKASSAREIQDMIARIEKAGAKKNVLPAQQRQFFSKGERRFVGDEVAFMFNSSRRGYAILDRDGTPRKELTFLVALDLACAILRDEGTRSIRAEYHIAWLPCRPSQVWIGEEIDRPYADVWDTDAAAISGGEPCSNGLAEPAEGLRAARELLGLLVELRKRLLKPDPALRTAQEALGILPPSLELVIKAIQGLKITPLVVGNSDEAIAALAEAKLAGRRELESLFADKRRELEASLGEVADRARKELTAAESARELLKADRDALEAFAVKLQSEREALAKERHDWQELSTLESEELKKKEAALEARKAALDVRERELIEREARNQTLAAERGPQVIEELLKRKREEGRK